MPAFASLLNDDEIAGVLNYIRRDWGNQAGEITADMVKAVRERFKDSAAPWNGDSELATFE